MSEYERTGPRPVVRSRTPLVVLLVVAGVLVSAGAGVLGIAVLGAALGGQRPHATAAASASVSPSPSAATSTGVLLYNTQTSKCADPPGVGTVPPDTVVGQWDCAVNRQGDNQFMTLLPTRKDGGTRLYDIRNTMSSLCLGLPGTGPQPATTQVVLSGCAADPAAGNQEWSFTPATGAGGQQGYEVVNHVTDLCLDVSGTAAGNTDTADGLPLTIYTCQDGSAGNNGYDDHIWKFLTDVAAP